MIFITLKGGEYMSLSETQKFQFGASKDEYIKTIITSVYAALEEKGYDPTSQMVGYILSGDPTYITSHNNARSTIRKIERDELLEVLVKEYVKK